MAHYPVNHHLRPLYRVVAGLIGLFYIVFGVLGAATSWGEPVFDRGGTWVLGLRTNLAWSVLALLIGALVLAAAIIGPNLYHKIVTVTGWGLLVLGLFHLALMQTALNILNFSMVNVVTCWIFGLLLIAAGLYGRVQPREEARTEPGVRHEPVPKVAPEELRPRS